MQCRFVKANKTRCKLKVNTNGLCWRHANSIHNIVADVEERKVDKLVDSMHRRYVEACWTRDNILDVLFQNTTERQFFKDWLKKQIKDEPQTPLVVNCSKLCSCIPDFFKTWMIFDFVSCQYYKDPKLIDLARNADLSPDSLFALTDRRNETGRVFLVIDSELQLNKTKPLLVKHQKQLSKHSVLILTTIPFNINQLELNQIELNGCLHEKRTKVITEALDLFPQPLCAIIAGY